jgi:hypothetical protein
MKQKRRWIVRVLMLLGGIYLLLSLSFYFLHDQVVFQPVKLSRDHVFDFDKPHQEFFIPVEDGIAVNTLLFLASQEPKGLVLYFHGNRDNLQRWGNYAVDFTSLGYDVLMIDYRGYGKSEGKPSEQQYYRDARRVYTWAKQQLRHDRFIIYGRSLGSAVASQLASEVNPDLLILETPFDELWGVVYPIFQPTVMLIQPRLRFSNAEHLKKVECKEVIIYGTNDWVVPRSSTERLKPLLKPGDEFVVIEGGSHNNLRDFPEYQLALSRILQ